MLVVPVVAFCVKASGLFSAPVLIVNVCVKSAMLFAPVLLMSSAASRDVPSHLGHFQNCFSVTPAQAGVHCHPMRLDSRLRGKDKNLQTNIENAFQSLPRRRESIAALAGFPPARE